MVKSISKAIHRLYSVRASRLFACTCLLMTLASVQGCSDDKPEKLNDSNQNQLAANRVKTEEEATAIAIKYIVDNKKEYVKDSVSVHYKRESNHWRVSYFAVSNRTGANRTIVINAADGKVIRFEGGE